MYNNTLNRLFNFFSCLERSNAMNTANKFISPKGVSKNLQQRLNHTEIFRNEIFTGRFREQFADDKLDAARARIAGNYKAGLM